MESGIYGWYFKGLEDLVPYGMHRLANGAVLLYIGTAPSRKESSNNLRKRIRMHLTGNASGSTLRLSLGSVLRSTLGIGLQETGRTHRLTFRGGERLLNEWLDENAYVTWQTVAEPWALEPIVIRDLQPPLNLQHNETHPFSKALRVARASAREEASAAG
jgi:hypothetical protein